MAPINLVFICSAVDKNDPVVANHVRWIKQLRKDPRVGRLHVLTLRQGEHSSADTVIQCFRGKNRLQTLQRFTSATIALCRDGYNCFFICQGGPYPALLLPLKWAYGVRLFQWKAHPHVSTMMRFYASYCDDLIFTSTPGSFPVRSDKVRVVGQGIDTSLFVPPETKSAAAAQIVMLGRITPRKRYGFALDVVTELRAMGHATTLDIYGPVLSRDREHAAHLQSRIGEERLHQIVKIHAPVRHNDLPRILQSYRVMLNVADAALDKSAAEAMAVGLPVVTTNPRIAEILPQTLRDDLYDRTGSASEVAAKLQAVLDWPAIRRGPAAQALRETVVTHHSLSDFFAKILDEIETVVS